MTQADSVLSTPPINTSALPVDPSRRRFLTVAAGASIISVGSLTAAEGINLSANTISDLAPKTPLKEITPSQGIEGDPIYEVIERHRKACREHNEALDIHMDFEELGMTGEKLAKYNRLLLATAAAYDELEDAGLDLINTLPTTLAGIFALCQYITPLFGETDQPNLPQYISYDNDTDAYPAEAFAYVIGRSIEKMMKAVQS